jgi:hypothetical protein
MFAVAQGPQPVDNAKANSEQDLNKFCGAVFIVHMFGLKYPNLSLLEYMTHSLAQHKEDLANFDVCGKDFNYSELEHLDMGNPKSVAYAIALIENQWPAGSTQALQCVEHAMLTKAPGNRFSTGTMRLSAKKVVFAEPALGRTPCQIGRDCLLYGLLAFGLCGLCIWLF